MELQNWSASDLQLTTSSNDGTADLNDEEGLLEAIPVVTDSLDGGWFGKIITSVMLVLGTFGNAMTITILRRLRSGWSAMNVYFTALALSDTVMLYSGVLSVWMLKVLHFDLYASHLLACKLVTWIMHTSAAVSLWLLVAVTSQRAASVVWPHKVNVLCTRQKSVAVIFVIVMTCCALYSHTLYGYGLVAVKNATSLSCTFGFVSYQRFWVNVWVKADLFIVSLLPCSLLILCNAVLGWKLALALKEAKQKLCAGGGEEVRDNRSKRTSSATVTIIIVSTAFVVTTLPLMTYNTFFHSYASSSENNNQVRYFLYDFFFIFGLCNFAWNFYLYCLTGSKFRGEFVKIVFGICRKSTSSESAVHVIEGTRRSIPRHVKEKNEMENKNDDF